MRVLSISTGKVKPLFNGSHPNYKSVQSAINKEIISNLEKPTPLLINLLGISGDEQADLSVHGGLEKAIYVYPSEHYKFWTELIRQHTQENRNFNHGSVGENLTIEGLMESEVWVGDIWEIAQAKFCVTKLREPCFKFNAHMSYSGASKAMVQSTKSGWYLRVLQAGTIQAGDKITVIRGSREISIAEQNRLLLKKNRQNDLF